MSCSRCGSNDHNLSGCKWPVPRIYKGTFGMWYCRAANSCHYRTGLGYTAPDAYQDWTRVNKINKGGLHASRVRSNG